MEFDDDNFYYDDAYDSCNEGEEYDTVNTAAGDANDRGMKYTVLSLNDICELQHKAITSICSAISVSEVEAAILLRHFYWDINKVGEQWFANEEKVRIAVGLLLHEPNLKEEEKREELIRCAICFDDYKMGDMRELKYCGHSFCQECWRLYIHTSINNDGAGCLNLRCPNIDPRCCAVVGEDMVLSLGLSEKDISKYRTYVVRSYVEQNTRVKWCPAPRCEYGVEVDVVVDAGLEVVCECSYKFCWNCLEESHRPINCDIVKKWVSMINEGDSQNLYWVICNCKPCPKCKRLIEKDHGCMHMRCPPPCRFHFCWVCLRNWDAHVYDGLDRCNGYRPPEAREEVSQGDNSQSLSADVMKLLSDRILFYFERWKANEKSQEKAFSDVQYVQQVVLKEMIDCRVLSTSRSGITGFKCVVDAWLQIVECRRMLKWTYAYGYYLSLLDNDVDRVKQKKILFEFLQGEAENSLEQLHQCAEHELQEQMECVRRAGVRKAGAEIEMNDIHSTLKKFDDFYQKLEGLTKATAGHFERLSQAIEN